jgi:RNA 2',3'-cyclic 3'-phosphodiesterase
MNNPIRLFIALELSSEIHQNLTQLITDLKQINQTDIKWVKPENIHLTLKFLGDTPQSKLKKVTASLEKIANEVSGFTVEAKGTGVFPTLRKPRTLWAGLSTPPELTKLQRRVEEEISPLGFPSDPRGFLPHLTLGRVSGTATPADLQRILEALSATNQKEFGNVTIKQVTLFQSTLASGGSIYTPLTRLPLLGR